MLLEEHQPPTYRSSNAKRRWLRLFVIVLGLAVIWSLQTEGVPRSSQSVNGTSSSASQTLVSHTIDGRSQSLAMAGAVPVAAPQVGQDSASFDEGMAQLQKDFLTSPLSDADQANMQAITASEWLGPLAPIAISPFFGITCLAALSQFGGDYLPLNSFISNNAVLQNPYVLWLFAGLTLLTSLPRLTKVSKPFAQAMDMLETYGAIITIVILRFASTVPASEPFDPVQTAMVVQMGWMSFPVDVLFSLAAIINIIVINSVKFFFEVMVWLVPFPFVDALLEVANKGVCLGLMTVYAYSPLIATVLNLVLFAVCLYVFSWTKRRVTYWRTMLTDPILALVWPAYSTWNGKHLDGFLRNGLDGIPAKASVRMEKTELGWRLVQRRWFFPGRVVKLARSKYAFEVRRGLMTNSIRSQLQEDDEIVEFVVSGRFKKQLDQISEEFGFQQVEVAPPKTVAMEF